nr:MAG: hypothetical protein [Tombusviridae sp.]
MEQQGEPRPSTKGNVLGKQQKPRTPPPARRAGGGRKAKRPSGTAPGNSGPGNTAGAEVPGGSTPRPAGPPSAQQATAAQPVQSEPERRETQGDSPPQAARLATPGVGSVAGPPTPACSDAGEPLALLGQRDGTPTPEEMLAGLREHVRRVLMWLPRTPENHAYAVRVVRSYLVRRDPDSQVLVAAPARDVLHEEWMDVEAELNLGLSLRFNEGVDLSLHRQLCSREPLTPLHSAWWSRDLHKAVTACRWVVEDLFPAGSLRRTGGLGFLGAISVLALFFLAKSLLRNSGLLVRARPSRLVRALMGASPLVAVGPGELAVSLDPTVKLFRQAPPPSHLGGGDACSNLAPSQREVWSKASSLLLGAWACMPTPW